MVQREREEVPVFQGCPVLSCKTSLWDRNFRILLTYFHPWTLNRQHESAEVPYVGNLVSMYADAEGGRDGELPWEVAYRKWIAGNVSCQYMVRKVSNFWRTFCARQAQGEEAAVHSDASDTPVKALEPKCVASMKQRRVAWKGCGGKSVAVLRKNSKVI